MGKKVAEIAPKLRFFIDYLLESCYNFIVARYCAQALDTPGRLGVRPTEEGWGIVTEPLYRGTTRRRSC